jgi:beta-N-acetylhexosaminidase
MKALSGTLAERSKAALAAGCDVVLHCNGDMAEMEAIAAATGALSDEAERRAVAAAARLGTPVALGEMAALSSRLDSLLVV